MASISRTFLNLARNSAFSQPRRAISVTSVTRIKQIIERQEGNTLIIEAKIVPDPHESRIIESAGNGACLLCSAGVNVKHTDVLILSQFLRSDGCMMPQRITGLCPTQQARVSTMVAMAQKAGLMPNIAPRKSNRDPKKRFGWKKFNVYYDETTIKQKYWNVSYRQ